MRYIVYDQHDLKDISVTYFIHRISWVMMQQNKKNWYLYMVICSDNSFYTGITTDLKRRVAEHNSSKNGAKYTRTRRPVRLVYSEIFTTKTAAAKREYQVKQLSHAHKRILTSKLKTD